MGVAIKGRIIDLWMPTDAEARKWGRKTVVITSIGSRASCRAVMVLVHRGMTLAARDHVPIGEERERIGDHEPAGDGRPQERVAETCLHRARDEQHEGVVDHLHDRDRHRVRGERDRHDRTEGEPGAKER